MSINKKKIRTTYRAVCARRSRLGRAPTSKAPAASISTALPIALHVILLITPTNAADAQLLPARRHGELPS